MLSPGPTAAATGAAPLLAVELRHEHDVVLARQRARHLAGLLGLDAQEQTRLATAVSEIARNAFRYAGGGRVEFRVASAHAAPELVVRVADRGPGIADLDAVLEGRYVSRTGMGLGIVGARRLTDRFEIASAPGAGTTVEMARLLPRGTVVTPATLERVAAALAQARPSGVVDELQAQNQELLRALDALQARQADIERLNRELDETNRGVLALYAELDERAQALKHASEQKSRFLSNVSHELRTPLSSILNISRLMLEVDAHGLESEHRRQLGFVRGAAQSLTEIVNDLLDLAKIEAGHVDVHAAPVSLHDLFGTLRGMFRPLVPSEAVALVFEEPDPTLALVTDEGKLAQVLRNLVSNALKYTTRGEVRVAVARDGDALAFTVADTGVGIAPEHHERIFEEFAQIAGAHQLGVKGTGLGLPLSRQLARLLGGTLAVASTPGEGSVFRLVVPAVPPRAEAPRA